MQIKALGYAYLWVLLAVSYIWLHSSYAKLSSGGFPQSLGPTLQKFMIHNPYPWYRQFIEAIVFPNAYVVGLLVQYAELLAGICILVGAVLLILQKYVRVAVRTVLIGLVISFFLNLQFWLAAGWTSPSADSLNLLLMIIALVGIANIGKAMIIRIP